MNPTDRAAGPPAPPSPKSRQGPPALGWALGIALPAAALCLLNAAKPLMIDDPAYFAFGRHVAEHPLDPYGFTFFWYQHPVPAFDVLSPPVFNYWLGLGIRLFGDSPLAAKLWLFPWCLLLTAALATLLRRFALPLAMPLLWMTVLSPAVLPLMNLMLDVPCLALQLAAVACFLKARDSNSWSGTVGAGLVAGLAMQTKYTALTAPVVLLAAAVLGPSDRNRRSILPGVVAAVVAVTVFASWEVLTALKYGESHFLRHLTRQDTPWVKKLNFVWPFVALVGGVGPAVGFVGLVAWRVPGRWIAAGMVAFVAGLAVLAYGPRPSSDGPLRAVVFGGSGAITLGLLAATAVVFARRYGPVGARRDDVFLAAWWVIEVAGAFAVSPWPAARRVIGPVVVGTLLAGRLAAITARSAARVRLIRVVAVFTILLGLFVHAIDIDNAAADRDGVDRVMTWVRDNGPDRPVYYVGHLGLQFYAERAGWQAVDPDHTRLPARSWLVVPARDFGSQRIEIPFGAEFAARISVDSRWPLTTIPWLHGTNVPLRRQVGPILSLDVYRVTDDCVPRTPTGGGMAGP
ncbi:MAG TPA: glycosyltransferase family 39 protein [Gemmataceae bacterium]|jgi:hypothetical protein